MSILKSAPRKIWSFLNVINSMIPKDDKKIFLYSNLGFRDNIRAIYDYLVANGYNEEYKIICSLNDYKKQIPQKNVEFVSNVRGLFSFFRSKHVFYCFGKYPVKPRNGQIVFNLWHGMPLKRVGNMVKGFEKTDYNYFTHVLCTSDFFRDIMKKSFSCDDGQIAICGQPRTDEMIRSASQRNDDRRIALWLPTFRQGRCDELDILSAEQFETLDNVCEKYGWDVVIKLHPLSEAEISADKKYKHIKILTQKQFEEQNGSLYTLLGQTDCLITDYSSVYFDYLLLDRPIGFAVGDMAEYEKERGFTFENPYEYMPGGILTDGEKMIGFLTDVMAGKDDFACKRQKLNNLFNRYCDGNNCKRAVEISGIRKSK